MHSVQSIILSVSNQIHKLLEINNIILGVRMELSTEINISLCPNSINCIQQQHKVFAPLYMRSLSIRSAPAVLCFWLLCTAVLRLPAVLTAGDFDGASAVAAASRSEQENGWLLSAHAADLSHPSQRLSFLSGLQGSTGP